MRPKKGEPGASAPGGVRHHVPARIVNTFWHAPAGRAPPRADAASWANAGGSPSSWLATSNARLSCAFSPPRDGNRAERYQTNRHQRPGSWLRHGLRGTLSPEEVTRKVEAAGYTNIHDLEYDDGRWELEATSPAGVAVDLDVDATTGNILNEEKD